MPPAPSFTADNFPAMHAAPPQAPTPEPGAELPALMPRPSPRSGDAPQQGSPGSSGSVSRADQPAQNGDMSGQLQRALGRAILAKLNAAAAKLGKGEAPAPAAKETLGAPSAPAKQLVRVPPKEEPPETRVAMKGVLRGAKLLGMAPGKGPSSAMRVEAPEFVPPSAPMSQASSGDLSRDASRDISRRSSGAFPRPNNNGGSAEGGAGTPGSQEPNQTKLSVAAPPFQPPASHIDAVDAGAAAAPCTAAFCCTAGG